MTVDLARMRLDYETAGIDVEDLAANPMVQFGAWFDDAVRAELVEPNAMVVSTVNAQGAPSSRHVLLKGAADQGFDFYTNYRSSKSADLEQHPLAAATFGWLGLHRQVNITGRVIRVSNEESDRYWAVRTRGSQIGAWASAQSQPLASRAELKTRYDEADARFTGEEVPRPQHWGGWRLLPKTVEFWQGRRNRLHDRIRYSLADTEPSDPERLDADRSDTEVSEWVRTRLSP